MLVEVTEDAVVRPGEMLAGEARGHGGIPALDGGQYGVMLGPDVPALPAHLQMHEHVAVGQAT